MNRNIIEHYQVDDGMTIRLPSGKEVGILHKKTQFIKNT